MSSNAWQSLNGPVEVSQLLGLASPSVNLDEPVLVGAACVQSPGPEALGQSTAAIGQRDGHRSVGRREPVAPVHVQPALELTFSSGATPVSRPQPLVSRAARTPERERVRTVLSVRSTLDPSASMEFHPVMRRLLIWSPPPPEAFSSQPPHSLPRQILPSIQVCTCQP